MLQKLRIFLQKYGHYCLYCCAAICFFSALLASFNGVRSYSFYSQGKTGKGIMEVPYAANYVIAIFLIWFGYINRPK